MFRIRCLLFSSVLVLACTGQKNHSAVLPYYNTPDFTPVFVDDAREVAIRVPHTISNFSFLNQYSVPISQQEVEGKIHVASFIFTRCGSICPVMTRNLKQVDDRYKHDTAVVLLSYSVTPWIDAPAVLKTYKQRQGINNPNWHFLTGPREAIYRLARTSYFAEEDLGFTKDSSEFLHTEHVILVDGAKRIRGIYNGTLQLEMEQLAADIAALKEEAR